MSIQITELNPNEPLIEQFDALSKVSVGERVAVNGPFRTGISLTLAEIKRRGTTAAELAYALEIDVAVIERLYAALDESEVLREATTVVALYDPLAELLIKEKLISCEPEWTPPRGAEDVFAALYPTGEQWQISRLEFAVQKYLGVLRNGMPPNYDIRDITGIRN
ncbi:MAG: hypothetical protein LBN02_02850 [Oscillospiraceae bacterium]|jgi:hypothetical protein|nr:hypothetical protein [Oscillospiraceae bacterium]